MVQSAKLVKIGLIHKRGSFSEQFEMVYVDLGDIAFDGVAVFPHTVAQLSFHIQTGALPDVFLGKFGGVVPHYNIMPFSTVGCTCAVGHDLPALGGGEREGGYGTRLDVAYGRVLAYVAYEYDLVNQSG